MGQQPVQLFYWPEKVLIIAADWPKPATCVGEDTNLKGFDSSFLTENTAYNAIE